MWACRCGMFELTDRELTEHALRESEERHRRLVESATDVIFTLAADGTLTSLNQAFERITGWSRDEWLGRPFAPLLHPDDLPLAMELFTRALAGEGPPSYELRVMSKSGQVVYGEFTSAPRVVDGAVVSILGIARDVTERKRTEDALRQTEERSRRLVEISPDGIVVHKQGVIVFANPAAVKLLGATSDEDVVGKSVLQFVHPDSRPGVLTRLQRLREGSNVPLVEERFVRLDGTAVDVEVAAAPFDQQGESAVQVVIRDITERKRTETALQQRNENLGALHETALALMDRLELRDSLQAIVAKAASLVGTSNGYIYLVGPDGDDMEMEVGLGFFAEWVGRRIRRGEGLAGKVWERNSPVVVDDYEAWEGRSERFVMGRHGSGVGVPLTSGTEVVGVLGLGDLTEGKVFTKEEIEVLSRFAPLASIALDNARLYTASQRELAERRLAEEALLESERRYRDMLENVQLATVSVDVRGNVTFCNDFLLALTGWRREEVLGANWFEVFAHDEDREAFHEDIGHGINRAHAEGTILTRQGDRRLMLWSNTMLRDPVGAVIGMSSIGEDITERKRAEETLREAFDQEKEASDRLRALDEMKTTFLHAVSHELRTPLASVLGMALTLENRPELSIEEQRDLIHRMAMNARKLDQLLVDLLDLDRLDRGILEPLRRLTDVGQLTRRTVESSGILGRRQVRVEAELVIVSVDAPKVERILENLLANAVRHTPPAATICVKVGPDRGGVLIVVEDTGPGVPQEVRDSIFEPFQQGPNAPAHSPGVGIGLSLVAKFAELHGGKAWVEDRPGGGASFRVFLPGAPV